jgi:hypothetical protein
MNEQPPPTPPQPPAGATGAPPPGWAPAALSSSGNASYAGQTAASAAPPPTEPTTAINQFAPKRSKAPVLVALAGIVIAGVVVYTANRPAQPSAQPTPTATKSVTASATPRDGTPFTVNSSTAGTWKITEHQWSDTGLDIRVQVRLSSGTMRCNFMAMSQSGNQIAHSKVSAKTPNFGTDRTITAGDSATGWMHFQIEHSPTTVFIGVNGNSQVQAIEVAA